MRQLYEQRERMLRNKLTRVVVAIVRTNSSTPSRSDAIKCGSEVSTAFAVEERATVSRESTTEISTSANEPDDR